MKPWAQALLVMVCGWLQGLAWAQQPARVVSLLPSTTELICRLGACSRLVGVDQHANHPESIKGLPRMGALGAWSLEALVRVRPDLVFIPRDPQLAGRLQGLGIAHRVIDPQNLSEVRQSFEEVAQALGLGAAPGQRLWQELQDELLTLKRSLPPNVAGQRVYLEVDSSGVVAGPSSYLGQLIEALGLVNAVGQSQNPYPQVSPESVLRAQPDWLILLADAITPVDQRPGWQRLRAVQQSQVCRYSAREIDVLVRPGPRLDQAARLLADCVQGRRRG